MKRVIKGLLTGLYWLLGASIFLGIVVGVPWLDRGAIQSTGGEWWHWPPIAVGGLIGVAGLIVLGICFRKLHEWAFGIGDYWR